MKTTLLSFLFFIFSFFPLFSQENIDSLQYYSSIINSQKDIHQFKKAYNYFKKKSLNNPENTNNQKVYSLFHLSLIEFQNGFYIESEETAIKALNLTHNSNENSYLKSLQKSLYNQLGILYRKQKNISKAIKLYDKSFSLANKPEDSISIYNNKANAYLENKDFSLALNESVKAFQIANRINNPKKIALVLGNLGYIKSLINKNNGLNDMLNALKLRKELKDFSRIYMSYQQLGYYFLQKKNYEKAKEYAWKAKNIAEKINSDSFRLNALSLLVDLNENDIISEYKTLNDSIQNARQQNANKFALIKYDYNKKEQEAQENLLLFEKEKGRRQFFVFVVILIFILSVSGYYYTKFRHEKNMQISILQRDFMHSKKVHDDIANDLYQVMQKTEETSPIINDLEKIYNNARDISREIKPIEIQENFSSQIRDLTLEYQKNDVKISRLGLEKCTWNHLSIEKKQALYKIIQELLINMRKHSFAKNVFLNFKESESKIEITYKDNGVGYDLKNKKSLPNVESRIKAINGKITFESELQKGFKAKIII
ncbi:ATP-binding protein [Aureivirga marina]|uniref:ATP-binding protein n=1 Tax=Aureivirga marina TaxID=1182451 RepID=UPI0018C9F82D|nr:hypothetical protein [Aureivirga marina]